MELEGLLWKQHITGRTNGQNEEESCGKEWKVSPLLWQTLTETVWYTRQRVNEERNAAGDLRFRKAVDSELFKQVHLSNYNFLSRSVLSSYEQKPLHWKFRNQLFLSLAQCCHLCLATSPLSVWTTTPALSCWDGSSQRKSLSPSQVCAELGAYLLCNHSICSAIKGWGDGTLREGELGEGVEGDVLKQKADLAQELCERQGSHPNSP